MKTVDIHTAAISVIRPYPCLTVNVGDGLQGAYFKYERITGMTKQCVYDYLGNEYTITIDVAELCPMTIEV